MKVIEWDGKPISQPGWYSDVPIERYHSANMCVGPSVSSSDLRTCWSKSVAHMQVKWAENPEREEPKETDAMLLGACAHHLLLGEKKFYEKYAVQPAEYPDKKTGILKPWTYQADHCKRWRLDQEELGMTVVSMDILKSIIEMSKTLAPMSLIKAGLLNGHVETSGFFKDKETGLWIKVRPDVIPHDDEFVDLKTAREVTAPAIMSSVRTYGYNQQGALIMEACEALGHPFALFTLLFIETSRPYCARAVPMPDKDIGLGERQNRSSIRAIAQAIDEGRWPGPGDGDLQDMGLSHDERTRIETRLKLEGLL